MGNICKSVADVLNLKSKRILKANRIHTLLIKQIIQKFAEKHNCKVSNFIIFTGKTGAHMKYYTFTVEKNTK